MKTNVEITIEPDLKEKLILECRKKGLSVSALTNMYFTKIVKSGDLD